MIEANWKGRRKESVLNSPHPVRGFPNIKGCRREVEDCGCDGDSDAGRKSSAGEGALGVVGLGKQSLFIVRASNPVTQFDNCWHRWKLCGI